ncbi:MAG: thioesterase family protein [Pseudomonadota bacterium]
MTPYLTPLPVADLRALGIPEPWAFGQADRVRFYELDALGHVNNTAYLRWFETLRVSWAISRGITTYRPDDPTFVLKHITCTYHAPLFLNDDYVVTARCESFRSTSFVKTYAVWSAGTLTAEGTAVGVCTDKAGTTKRPLSEATIQALREMDGAVEGAPG